MTWVKTFLPPLPLKTFEGQSMVIGMFDSGCSASDLKGMQSMGLVDDLDEHLISLMMQ